MLTITKLHNDLKATVAAIDVEWTMANDEAYVKAHEAYYAELGAAKALEAKYDAMDDVKGSGTCNAGDTYPVSTYGDDVRHSTEFWTCAINSVQMLRDFGDY